MLKRAALITLFIVVGQTLSTSQGQLPPGTLPAGAHHRWMDELFTERPTAMDQSLARFVFPGSHDAGTWPLSDDVACEDCQSVDYLARATSGCRAQLGELLGICNLVQSLAGSVGQAWGEAQHSSIGRQLDDGARFLDLRFFRATSEDAARTNGRLQQGRFYIHHTLAGVDSSVILNDIARFLAEPTNGREVLILQFGHMKEGSGDMGAASLNVFFEQVRAAIGDKMAPKVSPACAGDADCLATERLGAAATLRELLAQGHQVVVIASGFDAPDVWTPIPGADPSFVGGYPTPDDTDHGWRSDKNMQTLIDGLSAERDVQSQNEMFYLGVQVGLDDDGQALIRSIACPIDSLNAGGICDAVNDDWDQFQSLADVANYTNPMALAALVSLRRDRVNIVAADHYTPAFTEEAFKLNFGSTRVQYIINNVLQIDRLDATSQADYYPEFLYPAVAPRAWDQRRQRNVHIQNDDDITPAWPAWKAYPNNWGTAVLGFRLWDADSPDADDPSPTHLPAPPPAPGGLDADLFLEQVPITGCVTHAADCVQLAATQSTSGAGLANSSAVEFQRAACVWSWLPGDIVDADSLCTTRLPQISVYDAIRREGNTGPTPFDFVVTLSAPSLSPVTVQYSTVDGVATTADSDYTPVAGGTVTFAPGETRQIATVYVTGDTAIEGNETFTVRIAQPTGATIVTASATGTIVNDDVYIPQVSIDDVSAAEGNAGARPFTFTVSLNQAATDIASVFYTVTDGTATVGSDYAAVPSAQLVFQRGEITKTVTVNVSGDTAVESNETFFVTLSDAKGAAIAVGQGAGAILNDDLAPTLVPPPPQSGTEGASAVFMLGKLEDARPGAGPWTISVKWGDGTAETFTVSVTGAVTRAHAYDDNRSYDVSVHAAGADGVQSPAIALTIDIANVDPTATLGNNGPIDEGGTATISFSAPADPSGADAAAGFHYAFSCTNTPLNAATYANSGGSPNTTCSFPDNSTRTVRGRIIDKDGGFTDYITVVTVNDVPPVLSAPAPQTGSEGADGAFSLGTLSDPGADGPWAITVNWGDGRSDDLTSQAGPLAGTHAYADNGTYTVSVSVRDADNVASNTVTFPAVIANVAPRVTAGGSATVESGVATVMGTIADPGVLDGFTLTVSWGDGVTGQYPLAPGTATYSLTHQYGDDSPTRTPVDLLPVLVAVADKDGGLGSAAAAVTVANVAPVVSALALIDETGAAIGGATLALSGLPVTLAAPFTDAGPLDTHVATISWGDGTSEPGTLIQGAGSGTVGASHTWNRVGTFIVRVAVTDDDTGIGSREATIGVVDGGGAVCGLGKLLKPLLNDSKVSAVTKLKLKLLAGEIELACGLLTKELYVPALVKLVIAVAIGDSIIKGGGLSAANLAVLQQVQARLILAAKWTYLKLRSHVTTTTTRDNAATLAALAEKAFNSRDHVRAIGHWADAVRLLCSAQ